MAGPTPAVATVRTAVRNALTAAELPPGTLVLVAVSGGADSLALAAAAAFVAPRLGLAVGGVTVDHGWFADSAAHAQRVADSMSGLGLNPMDVVTVRAGAPGDPVRIGGGPEAVARAARYRALSEAADRLEAPVVLLGHSRDDQAETVLLGLVRGSGARSLAGMAARTGPGGRWMRPLLDTPRSVLAQACADLGLVPWSDPANADPRFARVRARALLADMESALGPGVSAALARSADLLRADAEALDTWADVAFAELIDPAGPAGLADPDGARALDAPDTGVLLAVPGLLALPTAVRTRVLRRAAIAAGSPAGELRATHVWDVDTLVTGWHGQGPIDLPGHRAAARSGTVIRIGPRMATALSPDTTR